MPLALNQRQTRRWGLLLLCLLASLLAAWRLTPRPQPPPESSNATLSRSAGLSRFQETGKRLYLAICTYCHGVAGDGFGLNAPNLAVPPRDHTDAAYMASRTDEQLFALIKYGGAGQGKSTLMPPWGGRLSDRDITALVTYLRTLSQGNPAGVHPEP